MSVEPTDLLGTWTFARTVDDRRAGERRDVHGSATLVVDSSGRIRWSEEGTMTWPGHAVPVTRTLFIERDVERDGDGWQVAFEDGRPFHPWAIGEAVDHPCGRDHYRGLIETEGDPVARWRVEWRATGPEKDYVLTTTLSGRRTAR